MSYLHYLDPKGEDYTKGEQAEKQFYRLFKAKYTGEIRQGSLQEDWCHADYVIGQGDKTRFLDVKAAKYVDGQYAAWIEIIGHGKLGWIYGKHDFVAFQSPHKTGFAVVGVSKLRDYVKNNIVLDVVNDKRKAWGKCYMRDKFDRSCDILALTTWEEIYRLKDWEL